MAQAATTTNQAPSTTNGSVNGSTENTDSAGKREPKALTAIEAITKITKILDQLSPNDRKRVLVFVNESNGSGE